MSFIRGAGMVPESVQVIGPVQIAKSPEPVEIHLSGVTDLLVFHLANLIKPTDQLLPKSIFELLKIRLKEAEGVEEIPYILATVETVLRGLVKEGIYSVSNGLYSTVDRVKSDDYQRISGKQIAIQIKKILLGTPLEYDQLVQSLITMKIGQETYIRNILDAMIRLEIIRSDNEILFVSSRNFSFWEIDKQYEL
jgi:hypothetical protein